MIYNCRKEQWFLCNFLLPSNYFRRGTPSHQSITALKCQKLIQLIIIMINYLRSHECHFIKLYVLCNNVYYNRSIIQIKHGTCYISPRLVIQINKMTMKYILYRLFCWGMECGVVLHFLLFLEPTPTRRFKQSFSDYRQGKCTCNVE